MPPFFRSSGCRASRQNWWRVIRHHLRVAELGAWCSCKGAVLLLKDVSDLVWSFTHKPLEKADEEWWVCSEFGGARWKVPSQHSSAEVVCLPSGVCPCPGYWRPRRDNAETACCSWLQSPSFFWEHLGLRDWGWPCSGCRTTESEITFSLPGVISEPLIVLFWKALFWCPWALLGMKGYLNSNSL